MLTVADLGATVVVGEPTAHGVWIEEGPVERTGATSTILGVYVLTGT